MNKYDKQAQDFLEKTNTTFSCKFLKYDYHFIDDRDKRDIYEITLKRSNRSYTFNFGQSLNNSGFKLINSNTGKELNYKWLDDMQEIRDIIIFKIKVKEKLGSLSGITIKEPQHPTAYDVLACLGNDEYNDFKDFCDEFGYSEDSRKAEKIYLALRKENNHLKMLYSDEELELLREIN